jgi:glyoxylase-like metal-dependent hydrolase (beta-lactamase superfamily II)
MDRSGRTIPVFPRAKYIVQKSCYDAIEEGNNLRISQLYNRDDIINLHESGQLELIDGDVEILKGINVKKTGGYSPGNQVFFINSGTEKYIYLGSLIPTPLHLVDNAIPSYAYSLNDTWIAKKLLIKTALDNGSLLIFGRARMKHSGYITEKYGKLSVDFREL